MKTLVLIGLIYLFISILNYPMKTLVLIVVKVSEVRDNRFIEKPVFSSSGLVFEDPVVSVGQ